MKTDYRTVINKGDIAKIRQALRGAIFMYSQPETPLSTAPTRIRFEQLLKRLHGMSIQQTLPIRSTVVRQAQEPK
jgi:hypothetical protein